MQKRYIRLKEVLPGSDRLIIPSPEQLETTDGSPAGQEFRCRTDGDGFIVTGNSAYAGQAMVFMGDSFVESMFAQETHRFISQVERNLKVRCLNAGYSGSTSLQLLNSLINKVYPAVGPDATIILFPPHSDRDNIYKDGQYWNNSQRGATLLPVMPSAVPLITTEGLDSFRQILRLFAAASATLGLRLVLATTPFRIADFSHDAPLRRLYRRNRELYNIGLQRRIDFIECTRSLAAETGTPLIDVESALCGKAEYFYDELHLNSRGHSAVSEVLSGGLRTLIGD